MDILNLKASATKISMMTASICGLNFFCLNELIFDSKQAISGMSIVGGVIVFAIISTYLVKKKNSPTSPRLSKQRKDWRRKRALSLVL